MVFLALAFIIVLTIVLALVASYREYVRTGGAEARRRYVYVDAAWDADGRLSDDRPEQIVVVRRRLPPDDLDALLDRLPTSTR